ncbi:MAG: undecaprenyl-diphosphate phosphatase [Bacteroidales bacterium]|nr:undecaprenyl-diphosphate phosphatase [Bacteroidales bacterium]
MTWFESLLLGILQGLTEFLPVSSSGHLTIGQELLNLDTSAADNLLFTVTVHAATVLSTIVILWKEIENLFKGIFFTTKWNTEKEYVSKILLSCVPVMIVGLFFKDYVEQIFGSGLLLVGCCLLLTATLLTFAYYAKPRNKEDISYRDAFIIGLSQAVAVLPGLSRSGTTIATGLILGNKKESIAQFSFLMVLIPILGETFLNVIDMIKEPTLLSEIGFMPLAVGFLGAFFSGCLACKFMINLVKKGKLIYFAIYCALAGAVTIIFSL